MEFAKVEYGLYNHQSKEEIGVIDGKLQYWAIYVNTTIMRVLSYEEGEDKYDDFEGTFPLIAC